MGNIDLMVELSKDKRFVSKKRPEHFIEIMERNVGGLAIFSPYGTENGLERHNPIIVVMGDSVTAGHFDFILNEEEMFSNYQRLLAKDFESAILHVEETDVLSAYPDLFRKKLVKYYDETCVNVINAGIAGDSIKGMYARCERDIIAHSPDLVVINGSLNWSKENGSANDFKTILEAMITCIKSKTNADIILLTPNGITNMGNEALLELEQRVEIIREMAETQDVCLADVYAVWEAYAKEGYAWDEMLANRMNHPIKEAHHVYANVLMNLIYKNVK